MVSIDARQLQALRGISGVTAVRGMPNYKVSFSAVTTGQPDLATTLAYVGGVTAQNNGFKGQGVRIAMLDTGIDYTHHNLGGSGNVADYNAAKAVAGGMPPARLFPTSKVIGGFDFTGEIWPNGPLAPDPNPIDLAGHGTLTADTAGGHSLDGIHFGAAPSSQLYAVKVCSSVSAACSTVAMAEGVDFALDPNNTGTLNNAVDIISMSIGGPFGQREDDVSEMFTDVVNFGVVSVISAGNDGNIPYVLGAPASTPEVVSLGATNSVVSFGIPLIVNSPASIAGSYGNTALLDWAPVNTTVTGNVVYVGRGCPANSISTGSPADAFLASPAGAIALIDRGGCAVSLKVDRAARAGALGVLIGLVAPGDAVPFSNGGGTDFVPTLVITQATSNILKSASGVNATLSPNNAISTVGQRRQLFVARPELQLQHAEAGYERTRDHYGRPGGHRHWPDHRERNLVLVPHHGWIGRGASLEKPQPESARRESASDGELRARGLQQRPHSTRDARPYEPCRGGRVTRQPGSVVDYFRLGCE